MNGQRQHEDVFGWELQLNLHACNAEILTDKTALIGFVEGLVAQIGMIAHGAPIVETTAPNIPALSGFTVVQLIETSSIVLHIVDKSRRVYANVFSCKRFDCENVVGLVSRFFETTDCTFAFSQRV